MTPETRDLIADRDGERLDRFVARRVPELTRSRVRRLIDGALITVDGRRPAKAGVPLEPGQRVLVALPAPEPAEPQPEAIPLRVVYEDADLVVVDKPAGIAVHPSPGHSGHTLVNAVLSRCPEISTVGGPGRPGIVHRLDRDTSGLVIVAKNEPARASLARQLKERSVEKTYLALVEGRPSPPEGIIDAPLARDPRNRKRFAVVEAGRDARTRFRVVRDLPARRAGAGGRSMLEVQPETGRTHQIRVHLAAIGHPVTGDPMYGRRGTLPAGLCRQFLHAQRLAFNHPRTGERLELEAPLAPDLRAALDELDRT